MQEVNETLLLLFFRVSIECLENFLVDFFVQFELIGFPTFSEHVQVAVRS